MRQPLKIILAVVVAAGIATGCGSDDDSPNGGSGGSGDSGGSEKRDASEQAGAPKPTSARGQMVKCIERAGFEVSHEDQDAATATNYTIEGGDAGSKKAEVVIHSNRDDARRTATKAAQEKGINSVAFGRARFIPRKATNTEAGIIANCVAGGYVN
ncbi:MAG TPA: hypothetical protein VGR11_09295 [Solirubrobacteraceae bacterium]|nr:hypothetical protein [Solirubrobacteraceae bacterium]